jgi:uncharacterized cofD-like protein
MRTGPRLAAVGGGHGLAATLCAARDLAGQITAIVAVADDGGSTGRLRAAVDLPALGDLRKALVALSAADSKLARAMTHRFDAGDVQGHAFGNLLIASLAETEGDIVDALAEIGRLVGAVGTVLPASVEPVKLRGVTTAGAVVDGQVEVQSTACIDRVELIPAAPPAPRAAVEAIVDAQVVVLGPGSLFTSVLAATAVPDIGVAIADRSGSLVYICNLQPQPGETAGYSVDDHVAALERHGIIPDVVLYDPDRIGRADHIEVAVPAVLAAPDGLIHDSELLTKALADLI